jgi:hypothetical protein
MGLKSRQAGELITELLSCPEATALCATAFDRAYLAWWHLLLEESSDFVPVAEGSGERLFQSFLDELSHQKGDLDRS